MTAGIAATLAGTVFAGPDKPQVEVWKSPTCGCCRDWIKHLEANGFSVRVFDTGNTGMRGRLGIPEKFGSCHTARVGGYAVEGHVPAREIHRLLKERPAAVGLAVPRCRSAHPAWTAPRTAAAAIRMTCCWSAAMAAAALSKATVERKPAMKPFVLSVTLASALLAPAWAQPKADEHSAHHPASTAAADEMVAGEIRKVDKGTAKITIKHAEIKSLDMPAMTMVFQVKEPGLLDKVKAGDKVRFKAEQTGTAYVVTAIEPVR